MSRVLAAFALLLLAASGPLASGAPTTTLRFELADGEAVALRLDLTAGDWPHVQAVWYGCTNERGVPPSIAQLRFANSLQDGAAGTFFEGPSAAFRAAHQQDGYLGIGATASDSGGMSLEDRCTSWESVSAWRGPKTETRVFVSAGERTYLYLTIRGMDSVASMDVARFPATMLDREDLYSQASAHAQLLGVEASASSGHSHYLRPPDGPFVGWVFAGRPDDAGAGPSSACQVYDGRCDRSAEGFATFSEDQVGREGPRLRLGIGAHAAVRQGVGYVAAIVPIPDGYVSIDRTPPETFVDPTGQRPDGTFVAPAEVHLDAIDDLSGLSQIFYTFSDPYLFQETYHSPLTFSSPGTHCFFAWAIDLWGNEGPYRRHCVTVVAA